MDLLKDNSERVLAIDYGEKRIGIAISDPLKMFPIPLKTILNNQNIWKEFQKVFSEYNIFLVIIGYPVSEDGSKTRITELVDEFISHFSKKFKVEYKLVDERYSSSIASEQILQSVTSKKKRRNKALIDMNAAAVILGDYLNNQAEI